MLPSAFKIRAALVLLQVAAFVAWEHWERPIGSAVETVFGILVFVALPVAILSVGRLPPLKLVAWPAICSAGVALLCASFLASLKGESGADNFLGFTGLFVECAALFIIGHSFVLASHIDGRIIARYPTYVDVSWTLAAQAIVAGLAFQTVYLLPIVVEKYLRLPIEVPTWAVFIVAFLAGWLLCEIWERYPGLTRKLRMGLLFILSWLLPFAVIASIALLMDTLVHGLGRGSDWRVFVAMSALIVLINAQFGDGQAGANRFRVLALSRFAAAVLLPFLTILALLVVRREVLAEGWTPTVVSDAIALSVMACYAVGYAATAAVSGLSLKAIPALNVSLALLVLALPFAEAMRTLL